MLSLLFHFISITQLVQHWCPSWWLLNCHWRILSRTFIEMKFPSLHQQIRGKKHVFYLQLKVLLQKYCYVQKHQQNIVFRFASFRYYIMLYSILLIHHTAHTIRHMLVCAKQILSWPNSVNLLRALTRKSNNQTVIFIGTNPSSFTCIFNKNPIVLVQHTEPMKNIKRRYR